MTLLKIGGHEQARSVRRLDLWYPRPGRYWVALRESVSPMMGTLYASREEGIPSLPASQTAEVIFSKMIS